MAILDELIDHVDKLERENIELRNTVDDLRVALEFHHIITDTDPPDTSIESGLPISPTFRASKYPLDDLEVGDSFFMPGRGMSSRLCNASHRWRPKEFTARKVNENGIIGGRIWRVS